MKVRKPDSYFSSGEWEKNVNVKEHKSLIRIATMDEVALLLDEGKIRESDKNYDLMFSTRGALESLRKDELER